MSRILTTLSGHSITIDSNHFGQGGAGTVHRIEQPPSRSDSHCVKIYSHKEFLTDGHKNKLLFQIKNPPKSIVNNGKFVLCWPIDLVFENGKYIGFVMPMAFSGSEKMTHLTAGDFPNCTPDKMKSAFARNTHDGAVNRLGLCWNIATAIHNLHNASQEYVLVDLKPENFLFTSDRKISVIDLDNVQISQHGNVLHHANLTSADYQPVEGLNGTVDPACHLVDQSWDLFALAVLYYKLLFGIHPYHATFSSNYDGSNAILNGLYVHGSKSHHVVSKHPYHDCLRKAPQTIQDIFYRAFDTGHSEPEKRPTAENFAKLFYGEYDNLKKKGSTSTNDWIGACSIAKSAKPAAAAPTPSSSKAPIPPVPTPVHTGKRFNVYHHPIYGYEAIKQGFSWPAFFFHWIWMLICKLWSTAVIWLVLLFIIEIIKDANRHSSSVTFVALLCNIGLMYVAGKSGNEWRETTLLKRGFSYLGAIPAKSPKEAISLATQAIVTI